MKDFWKCFFLFPVHGGWSRWTEVNNCNDTIGKRLKYSIRYCNNPIPKFCGTFCGKRNIKVENCTGMSFICKEQGTLLKVKGQGLMAWKTQ